MTTPEPGTPSLGTRVLLVNDHPAGGIGRYVRQLWRELRHLPRPAPRVDLLLQNVPRTAVLADWSAEVERIPGSSLTVQRRPVWAKQRGYGTLYQLTSYYRFPRQIPAGYSLYHVSSQMMGNSVRHAAPTVVTCQDVLALRMPGNHPWLATRLRARHLRALPRAAAIIFTSEFSRRDFLSQFDYPEERTAVVPLGVDDAFAPGDKAASRALLGLPSHRPVILHVGTEERRKNVETLLRAIRILADRVPDPLLVRVGGQSSRARRIIARLQLEPHVRYLHDLSDADLTRVYAAADVFVFPSLFEGFGLPALEALKSGCPVVAASATAIPEIAGDAALLVDPMDAAGFAAAAERVLADRALRDDLVRRGLARAALFTWPGAARQTVQVYERALGR